MGAKLSELTQQRLRNKYVAALQSETKVEIFKRLSTEFKVGASTIKRLARENDWESLRVSTRVDRVREEMRAIAIPSGLNSTRLDFSALITAAISDLIDSGATAKVLSKESAYRTASTLTELWLRFNPLTIDDLIDAMERTGTTPVDIAKRLRERLQQTS